MIILDQIIYPYVLPLSIESKGIFWENIIVTPYQYPDMEH